MLPVVEQMVERYPDRYRPLTLLQTCYELLGRADELAQVWQLMIERLSEYLQRHPNVAHARSLLAIALARTGQLDAAIAQAQQAYERSPFMAPVHYNLACVLAVCGQSDRAMAELKRLFSGYPPGAVPAWPLHDPDLVTLRGRPDFQKLFAAEDA